MPFSRLLPRTQKTSLIVAIGAVATLLAVVAFQTFYFSQSPVVQNVNYTELRALVTGDAAVRSLLVEGELLVVERVDGTRAQAVVTNAVAQQEIVSVFEQKKLPVVFNTMQPGRLSTAMNWLITLLTLGVIAFVGWRLYASMSGGHGDFELSDASGNARPTALRSARRTRRARHPALRPSRHGQNPARPRGGHRGQRPFLIRLRFKLSREVCRSRRGSRPSPLQTGAQTRALRRLHRRD